MKRKSGHEKTLELIKSTHEMTPEDALLALTECTKKGFSLASVKAVQFISKLDCLGVVDALLSVYSWAEEDAHKRDNLCNIRAEIVNALGEIDSNEISAAANKTLCKAARTVHITKVSAVPEDTAICLRANAALALAKTDPNSLYELLLLLHDKESDVRQAAARALSILGDVGAPPLLTVKLKFPEKENSDVLAECLESLIFLRPPYLMEVVKPFLDGADEYLAAITALALAENLREEVLDLLVETLENVHGETKEAVVVAISATRCNRAKQILLEFLKNPNTYIRRGAVKGIKSYLDDEIEEKLNTIYKFDTDEKVRQAAQMD